MRRIIQMDVVPGLRAGPFWFGNPLPTDAISDLSLEREESGDETMPWEKYVVTLPEHRGYIVYVEDGLVTNVDCYVSCLVEGRNLIGLGVEEVEALLGSSCEYEGEEELTDGPQSVYSIDALGLQLWASSGRIVTVQCSAS